MELRRNVQTVCVRRLIAALALDRLLGSEAVGVAHFLSHESIISLLYYQIERVMC